ncbi:MAG: hypothetical protein R3C61_08060 [Bacteroidia bacterium]
MLKVYFLTTQGFQFQGQAEVTLEEMSRLGADLSGLNSTNIHTTVSTSQKRNGMGRGILPANRPLTHKTSSARSVRSCFLEGLGENIRENKTEHLIVIPALNIQQIPLQF